MSWYPPSVWDYHLWSVFAFAKCNLPQYSGWLGFTRGSEISSIQRPPGRMHPSRIGPARDRQRLLSCSSASGLITRCYAHHQSSQETSLHPRLLQSLEIHGLPQGSVNRVAFAYSWSLCNPRSIFYMCDFLRSPRFTTWTKGSWPIYDIQHLEFNPKLSAI